MKVLYSIMAGDTALVIVEEGPAEDAAHLTAGYLRCYTPYGETAVGLLWDDDHFIIAAMGRSLSGNEEGFLEEAGFKLLAYA